MKRKKQKSQVCSIRSNMYDIPSTPPAKRRINRAIFPPPLAKTIDRQKELIRATIAKARPGPVPQIDSLKIIFLWKLSGFSRLAERVSSLGVPCFESTHPCSSFFEPKQTYTYTRVLDFFRTQSLPRRRPLSRCTRSVGRFEYFPIHKKRERTHSTKATGFQASAINVIWMCSF